MLAKNTGISHATHARAFTCEDPTLVKVAAGVTINKRGRLLAEPFTNLNGIIGPSEPKDNPTDKRM